MKRRRAEISTCNRRYSLLIEFIQKHWFQVYRAKERIDAELEKQTEEPKLDGEQKH